MRALSVPVLGAALFLAISPLATISSAHADPAYTSDKVLDIFKKDKAAAESAKKLGASRKICFESDPDCGAPPALSATRREVTDA